MQTFTFTGETPAEALKKARDELGDDAMILKTQEVRKKSLNQSALYELVVGVEDSAAKPLQEAPQTSTHTQEEIAKPLPNNSIQKRLEAIAEKEIAAKKKQRSLSHIFDDDVTIELSNTVREISKLAGLPTSMPEASALIAKAQEAKEPKAREPIELAEVESIPKIPKGYADALEPTQERAKAKSAPSEVEKKLDSSPKAQATFTPIDETNNIKEIQSELKKLNDKIKLIQNTLWDEKSPKNMSVAIPKEFAEIYRIAKNSGMNKAHLEEIMRLSLEFMPLKMREQSQTIRRYFREVLRKMIYCRKENSVGKKIIMLVGPTGVGKTTTLAKLAARYSQILPEKKKVGIITLDDYRIGAMEQLAWYARKMRISIDSASESDDFINKIEALSYCDYILIDTAGHSQHDREKINELKRFIRNDEYKIDVTLVLSASTKYEDLKDAYNAFGELGVDTFIFSKLDEARGLGNIFSLVYETKKPISYLTIGQEVPSDVVVADNMYLADCLISGFFYPSKAQ
ncbi:flagellar biosynthesis protein FlhF [Helicobacter canis]|uniref:Flagellar biosynthesis protein FlhF n=2 Tax=Helicobacter canis TaxID=29419 RepID=A0A5M9QL16_9HELI|nr:flagellar biosynthesis protein FlhF [Helicobacter canis]KAA8709108.1 flagellar biosynthesis protein FlhF [Helicobacter canis]